MENALKFLHVGCGKKSKQQTPFANTNWREIKLDINPDVKPDLIGSMTNMNQVEDECIDAIYSSHNIEHLYPHEVPQAIQEFKRILKPDGFILITCPDLQSVCEFVAKDQLLEPLYSSPSGPIAPVDIIFGHRAALQRGDLYMAHRCGFTAKAIVNTLGAEGLNAVASRHKAKFDLWAIASISHETDWLIEKAKIFFPQELFHEKNE